MNVEDKEVEVLEEKDKTYSYEEVKETLDKFKQKMLDKVDILVKDKLKESMKQDENTFKIAQEKEASLLETSINDKIRRM